MQGQLLEKQKLTGSAGARSARRAAHLGSTFHIPAERLLVRRCSGLCRMGGGGYFFWLLQLVVHSSLRPRMP